MTTELSQVEQIFVDKATKEEHDLFYKLRDERFAKVENLRGLMLKAELSFVAIATPLYLSLTITGLKRLLLGISICLSLIAVCELIVLLNRPSRQLGEVLSGFMKHVLTRKDLSAYSGTAKVTHLESVSELCWRWTCALSLASIVAAVFL